MESKNECSHESKKGQKEPLDRSWGQGKDKEENVITEKERTSHFLKGEYTVESISKSLGQSYFEMKGYPRKLMRSDIAKV